MDQKKEIDAFIGIDIDIEPPVTAGNKARQSKPTKQAPSSSKSGTSRKRPRPSSTTAGATASAAARKRPKKPKPPPNPPSSLVSLLQNDASVRSYFQSLQENLDYDVDKWKHEATRWKRLATSSSSSSPPKKNGTNGAALVKSKKAKPKTDTTKKTKKTVPSKLLYQKNNEVVGNTIPITDDALFGDIGSDDDSSNVSSTQEKVPHGDATTNNRLSTTRKSQDSVAINSIDVEMRRSHIILEKLKEAKKCLDMLGVSLVEVEVKSTVTQLPMEDAIEGGTLLERNAGSAPTTSLAHEKEVEDDREENIDQNAQSTVMERILHRQSDEKVAAEMMASLRTFIKASLFTASSPQMDTAVAENNLLLEEEQVGDKSFEGVGENQQLSPEERIRRCRLRRQYHPFCRDGELHVPTVYYADNPDKSDGPVGEKEDTAMPEHPASVGLKHLMNVLSIMDTYCGDDLEEDDWNTIFACDGNKNGLSVEDGELQDEDLAILQIGFRNRCRLTERVLSSLDVEITRVWALTDRATNLATTTIHFHPADVLDMDDPENENIHNKFYGAKSYNRLTNLEERIAHARIASLLHHRCGNLQKAAELAVGFIISSAPSMGAEQYPRLPPVLSMALLEALLAPENYVPKNVANTRKSHPDEDARGWFQEHVRHMFTTLSRSNSDESVLILLRALAYPVHVAASIWRERSLCSDDRIRDAAVVELAAYDRIQRLGTWLTNPTFEMMNVEHISKLGADIFSSATSISFLNSNDDAGRLDSNKKRAVSGISCIISLLTLGDVDRIILLCGRTLLEMKGADDKSGSGTKIDHPLFLLPAYCSAYSSVMYRKWESMKLGNTSGRHTAAAFTVQDKFSPILDSVTQYAKPDDWSKIDIIIQCCVLLGDGRSLQRLANRVLPNMTQIVITPENSTVAMNQRKLLSRTMASLIDAGEIPTVRVINLRRRPDRALDFMGCAVHKEQLIVVKGPAKLRHKSLISARKNVKTPLFIEPNEDEECPGDFAFDGQCTRDELEKQVLQRLDGKGTLADFVKAKWRPSDLKAFDRDARDGFELVQTSMTEKACALSHIASWMGVESTLSHIGSCTRGEYDHEFYQKKLSRMFKISGFARGPALLPGNEDMDPVPVCVILEDDAVVSDRFAERLASLLEELPRDFHFCSLGYSRPKNAPMVEYSTHLGIPSCLWYLTGYILSLEGARHLIKSLPVTGPVDSWIGMKMCGNWDNTFGEFMGVGKYTRAKTKLPSRKDLAKIMKFRAFAALIPLCAQTLGTTGTTALTRGGWRNKDTDITYSG